MNVNDFVTGDHLKPLNFSAHPQQPENKKIFLGMKKGNIERDAKYC